MDEESLRAVTIGELVPYQTKIVIADYDPAWPDRFAHDREKIESALGPAVLSIEHVGSTSVPDLPAKPVIDILLQVTDSAAEDTYVPPLEAAGYTLRIREPDWFEHRNFHRRTAPHDVNLHVLSPQHGAAEIERMLAFRDRLRTHEEDRIRYAETKRKLSKKDWRYVNDYAEAKTTVINQILAKALA